jgi:signal transduction histidine kinase
MTNHVQTERRTDGAVLAGGCFWASRTSPATLPTPKYDRRHPLERRIIVRATMPERSVMEIELARVDIQERGEDPHGSPFDVSERTRAEIELAGEKQLLEMIATGRPLPDVLDALCRFFETAAPGCVCGVYPIDRTGATFQNAVAPSLPPSYLAPVEGLPVTIDVAPCGTAAVERTQVIVEDIDSDPRWRAAPYRNHVLTHGLRAVWSTPISSLDGGVLGTFCIYRRAAAIPSPHVQELIAQITHIASIAIDRARNEAALRRSEAFLAQAQRLTLTGSLWWKTATGDISWSEETYRLMEYPVTVTPTIALIMNRVHPDDVPLVLEKVAACRRDGINLDLEHRLLMPNGTIKHVHVVLQNVAGEIAAPEFVGAVTDITDRKLAQEALGTLRSELAHVARVTSLGALTASIAHEVNQPLAGIVTNAGTSLRMLGADPPNVEGARETARRTIRDANRAADVITRLRALFAKKAPTVESLDLNAATREVIALWRSELQRTRATLRAELADDLPTIIGDRVQLQQVIINLLRNASEAMSTIDDRPREIVIRTELDHDDCVMLSVRDVGVGFDSQNTDKLFDAFYTTKREGMGIGLSVSRSILESHGGRLWAVSNDGPGVTFSFSIPRRSDV